MTVDTRVRLEDTTNVAAQWAANLLGPIAALLALELGYIGVQPACVRGARWPIHASFGVMLVTALVAGYIGWREWRRWGEQPSTSEGGADARSRFMAVTGMLASGVSALVILAQWAATLFFTPCE